MMRVGFVEWPDGLLPAGKEWDLIRAAVDRARPDLLITNELPFGPWLAGSGRFEADAARRSVELHDAGLAALADLDIPAVLSSRPVWAGDRLANEAFVLERSTLSPLHRKHFFPAETGWQETAWFHPDPGGFRAAQALGATLGALLCTEVMFNEFARAYGKAGAEIIAVPRATGDDHAQWATACAMAAIVSGAYVISSNRVGQVGQGPVFGGRGMAFGPDGSPLARTSAAEPLVLAEVDLGAARQRKAEYPCYVAGPG
jgi:N-carbamoylputrescine amidase